MSLSVPRFCRIGVGCDRTLHIGSRDVCNPNNHPLKALERIAAPGLLTPYSVMLCTYGLALCFVTAEAVFYEPLPLNEK